MGAGRVFVDSVSVALDPVDPAGRVTGRLTTRGVTCGALDEPLVGTWDGSVLRFESRVKPDTNTQRMNGNCGSGVITYVMTRRAGQSGFEGEATRDGMPTPVQVQMSP